MWVEHLNSSLAVGQDTAVSIERYQLACYLDACCHEGRGLPHGAIVPQEAGDTNVFIPLAAESLRCDGFKGLVNDIHTTEGLCGWVLQFCVMVNPLS